MQTFPINDTHSIKVAMRALHEAVIRMEAVVLYAPDPEDADGVGLGNILKESGLKSVTVAFNALETLDHHGFRFSLTEGEKSNVFVQAYEALSDEPLSLKPEALRAAIDEEIRNGLRSKGEGAQP